MPRTTRKAGLALGLALTAGLTAPVPATAADARDCSVRVVAAPSPRHWDPLTDELWSFERGQVVLTEPGVNPGGPRRPFEYAVVTKGPELSTVRLTAEVRIDEAVEVSNRDVILIWNYQSPTRFYYAHLSTDNTIYPHNGIFVVDDADRRRIDDQWDEAASVGAPPAITDADWHDVEVDYDAATGEIAVRVDGADEPLMTATDTTFAGGRVGFGSFDNFGRARHVRAVGLRAGDQTG
ncbi:hypothetical protein [Nocardioides euryhalodurans]|uniref:hypothetical protein n=1 Tax=Nocardioides euryhalodurans TaxID=2518370 RepID=UPI001ABDCE31|nr:hypothetical protein [Nocardioides euryhalodurans]